ncbi:MAG: 1-acyl-sn-glycerol-3-phosphate acyltransferase, partial [Thiovulaceae bacterium]|nr:1-acyl-sn-glycerol-3-phosphate acyltransferase [Sulfurimonadaceae bacterium]
MVKLGYKYIKIFKKTYRHPFITHKQAFKQLSNDRQAYANSILNYLNIEIHTYGDIPRENHKLYTINHRSLLDIIVMESIFSKHNKSGLWIAKEELFNAFYGEFFKYSGNISVDIENKKGLISFFKKIKYSLHKDNDINIYIFPEGERNKTNNILKFQSGAQKIAKSNKLGIVPVYINDSLENVLRKAPFKDKKIVEVHFGDIIGHSELEEEYKK